MAEAFAPSVGMDIGASNVRPSSEPSVDFSSVGRAIGSMFEKPTVTQADKENSIMALYAEDLKPLQSLENKREFDIRVASLSSAYAARYPGMAAKFNTAGEVITGNPDPLAGTPARVQQQTVNAHLETDRGRALTPTWLSASMENGQLNQSKFDSLVLSDATFAAQKKVQLEAITTDKTMDDTTRDNRIYGNLDTEDPTKSVVGYFPANAQKISEEVQLRMNKGILKTFQDNPMLLTPELAQEEMANVDSMIAEWKGVMTAELATIPGMDMSSERVNKTMEAALQPLKSYKELLNKGPEYLKALAETTKNMVTVVENKSKLGTEALYDKMGPALAAANLDPALRFLPEVKKKWIEDTLLSENFTSINASSILSTGKPLSSNLARDPVIKSGMTFNDFTQNPADISNGEASSEPPSLANGYGVFTPQEVEASNNPEPKAAEVTRESAFALLAGHRELLKPGAFNEFGAPISITMLQAMKEDKVLPNEVKTKFFGPDMMNLMDGLVSTDPNSAQAMGVRLNGLMVNQIQRETMTVQEVLTAFAKKTRTQGLGSMFKIEIKNNTPVYSLNEQALAEHAEFRDIVTKAGSRDPLTIMRSVNDSGLFNEKSAIDAMFGEAYVDVDKFTKAMQGVATIATLQNKYPESVKPLIQQSKEFLERDVFAFSRYTPKSKAEVTGMEKTAVNTLPPALQPIAGQLADFYKDAEVIKRAEQSGTMDDAELNKMRTDINVKRQQIMPLLQKAYPDEPAVQAGGGFDPTTLPLDDESVNQIKRLISAQGSLPTDNVSAAARQPMRIRFSDLIAGQRGGR